MKIEKVGGATLYLGDCMEIIPTLERVDAIITDPPYSSGGQFRSDRSRSTNEKYSSAEVEAKPDFSGDNRDQRSFEFWMVMWLSRALAVCKPGAIVCLFTDWRQLPVMTDIIQAGGFVWRGVVPWDKVNTRPQMGRFMAQCEYLVWGSAGPLPLERGVGVLPGMYRYASQEGDAGGGRLHVTQKPLALMKDLCRIVAPGGVVLDPFMGSGTTGAACMDHGLRFIGCEIEEGYFHKARERIENSQRQERLFAEQ